MLRYVEIIDQERILLLFMLLLLLPMTLEMFKVYFSELSHRSGFGTLLMHHFLICFQIGLIWISRAYATVMCLLFGILSMLSCLIRIYIVGLPLPIAGSCCLRFVAAKWNFQIDLLIIFLSAICLLAITSRVLIKLSVEPTLNDLLVHQFFDAHA